jgi:hypothetical protein
MTLQRDSSALRLLEDGGRSEEEDRARGGGSLGPQRSGSPMVASAEREARGGVERGRAWCGKKKQPFASR